MTSRRLTEAGETPEEAIRIRNQNRNVLHTLVEEFAEFKRGVHPEMLAMRQEIQQLKQGDSQAMRQELQQLKSEVQKLQESHRDVHTLKTEVHSVKGATQEIKSEMKSVKETHQEVQGMKTKIQSMEKKHPSLVEKQELKSMERKQSEYQNNLNELTPSLASLQEKTNLTKMEFDELKHQIYSRGLLAPKLEMPEDPEEPPPVGAIQLGEDVFTARLLVHLGFMKARKDSYLEEQQRAHGYSAMEVHEEDDDDSIPDDEDEPREFIDDSNIHGITDIVVYEGGPGHCQVTWGWLLICLSTFLLQVLVVLILIQGAEDQSEGCLKEARSLYNWWLLHLSKGVAVGVASILMGRELMDVVNYAMVSWMVEPHVNFEVMAIALSRILLAGLIGIANVIIFSYLKHPSSVWINMTALAFIGELGTGMLDVARRGVFGHHIMKTMTGLNFELTLCLEYPRWHNAVRFVMLGVSFVFGLSCAIYSFTLSDQICADGGLHNGTQPFFPDGGGGHVHPHEHR